MTWYFDSHIHLSDSEFSNEIPFLIKQMEMLKIKSCCVSMDYENSLQTLDLSDKSPLILPFVGIHPERASDDLEKVCELIESYHKKIYGIGEIGLDPTYANSNDETKLQRHVFETLLGMAEKYNKPVSIHSRKSLDDVFDVMSSFDTKHALLHWFDGSKKSLQKAMDMDFFVSFGPVMVYANDKQTLLSKSNESKILVETDGPVRFSRCFEKKSGQITFIPSIIFSASKILGKSFEETALIFEKNSKAYLGI